jgi:hypothetical protein
MRFLCLYKPGKPERPPTQQEMADYGEADRGGHAIIQASSKQEAIERTKYFLQVAGGGETEIRQLHVAPAAATARPQSREHGEGLYCSRPVGATQ